MNVNIIKSKKRKTVSLQVTAEAEIIVRVPHRLSSRRINEIVNEKKDWLQKKYKIALARLKKYSVKKYVNGEKFLYLGDLYNLNIVVEQDEPLKFENEFLLANKWQREAKELFANWYRKQALIELQNRVQHYSLESGIKYSKVKISNAKKRWGSCSINGNLNFNWRLIMAPKWVLDYVVAHELSHLEHRNHSRVFWNRVKEIYPRFKEAKKWLKINGHNF